jgi:hypothetical protein
MSALAACTSGEGDTVGNTELNILVPNNESSPGVPAPIDIGTVEYTINCLGNDDTFLDNNDSFPDEVIINGNLEVVDGRTDAQGPIPPEFGTPRPGDGAEIWQAFMDLPPGPCTIQLRARDNDGEVICTATESFSITADTTSKVNLVLICDVSFQAPVGMLDVDATFSFVVGNFCPDLFQLNCVDSFPQLLPILGAPPVTYCEARARDGDGTCGQSCDPQDCTPVPEGLSCVPGPDPGVSTTITCDQLLDCEGDLVPDASCVFAGDILGNLGAGIPVPQILGGPGPLPGGFFAGCVVDPATGNVLFPGSTVTCTAVTTDGDLDCDKTKQVRFVCEGLPACAAFDQANGGSGTQGGADALCDDGNDCTANVCDNATCDGATAAACCASTNVGAGTLCRDAGGFPGMCDGAGVCLGLDCLAQPDPDGSCDDGNVCTVNTCTVAGACISTPTNEGACCFSGVGSGGGSCAAGSCVSNDECFPGDGSGCPVAGECFDPTCIIIPHDPPAQCGATTCSSTPSAAGTACISVPGGTCDGSGSCVAPSSSIDAGAGSTASRALPKIATAGSCVYDAATTTCSGCVSSGVDAPGGGDCGAFGVQEFQGCEVQGGVLNSQLAMDVTIQLDIVSDGTGSITHDFTVTAVNPALVPAAGLVTVDAATIFASVAGGSPSQLQNDLNPALAGQPLGAFTGGTNTVILDNDATTGAGVEIPTVTTVVTPTVPAGGSVTFDYDTFSLTLTIVATGAPLTVDDAGCVFDVNGPGITVGVN